MTREHLSVCGFQRALKHVLRSLPTKAKPAISISCHVSLYVVAMNIRHAVRVSVGAQPKQSFPFRIRIRVVKRGWELSARHGRQTVKFQSSKDVS